ncbi:MAG: hypothetical protein GY803_03725, partial [Chloroflexi bacterium]|nr:hypothetical protein [Chloroflexota bacterium]
VSILGLKRNVNIRSSLKPFLSKAVTIPGLAFFPGKGTSNSVASISLAQTSGATINITTTDDDTDDNGNSTLREAIIAANTDSATASTLVTVNEAGPWAEIAKLLASDGAAYDVFGSSIAVDGNTAVVGAYGDDDNGATSGSAYIFTYDGATWTQQAKPLASDGAADDRFGDSVAISGDTVVVGAYRDDDKGTDSGSAYVFSTVTSSSTRTWQQITTTTAPPVWGEYALAYDGGRDATVLYGGNADGWPYENETWEFDGADWAVITTTTQQPNAVYGADMVYDGSRILLFGGSDVTDAPLAETWAFNGTDWTQLTPTTSPPNRTNHTLVYNSANGDIYLFGGNDGGVYFNDLWRFDGANWSEMTITGQLPPARALHGMAYDANDNAILMFGGRNASGAFLDDSWSFDVGTSTWTEITASGPAARQALGLAYDPTLNSLILVGGVADAGDTVLNDTWHFQDGGWIEAEPIPMTSGTAYHTLVYDSVDDAILLFANGEPWEYK